MAFNDTRKDIVTTLIEVSENTIYLSFDGFTNRIHLTTENTDDLKNFYNELFDKTLSDQILFRFVYNPDERTDLFSDVTSELIEQLNNEISSSASSFTEIQAFLNK